MRVYYTTTDNSAGEGFYKVAFQWNIEPSTEQDIDNGQVIPLIAIKGITCLCGHTIVPDERCKLVHITMRGGYRDSLMFLVFK